MVHCPHKLSSAKVRQDFIVGYFVGVSSTEGVISYSMPQGERRGPGVDLLDFTYDGTVADGYLSGGIGQLMDGVEGPTNFRFNPDGSGRKGYDWIGWKNESGSELESASR